MHSKDFLIQQRLSHPSFQDRLAFLIIVVSILLASLVYLYPAAVEFPIDDPYIHFVYARNLAERGELIFNYPGEKGVGTSSLLWVLLLAGGYRLGLSIELLAKALGVASLITLGLGLYLLLRPVWSSWKALISVLFVVLSGHMLWFALSGMETVLFLALGVLVILAYRDERWGWMGLLLGLLFITRLEGVVLAVIIGVIDIWRYKAVRRGLILAGVISALILAPWVLYFFLRSGHFLPTGAIGNRVNSAIGLQVISGKNKLVEIASHFLSLLYPLGWIIYLFEFVLGGNALPPPYLRFDLGSGSSDYKLSLWAIAAWITVVIPLLFLSVRSLVEYIRKPGWQQDGRHVPLVIFLLWVVLHNLSYMLYFPTTLGAASRYGALNHIALWLALASALWAVRRPVIRIWLAAGLTSLALTNTLFWNRVYDANLEHMLKVRIAAADYLVEHIPPGDTCAAFDVGAVRYHSARPVLDLAGLIDPDLFRWYQKGQLDRYLQDNHVTCLVLPGRMGVTADGWFDVAKEMGLTQSPLFSLKEEAVFQMDRERWLLGNLPVANAQATAVIYRLVPK